VQDYHTTGKKQPEEDASQDWFLLQAEENDKGTVLKFVRSIDTCDVNDIAINVSTVSQNRRDVSNFAIDVKNCITKH